MSYVSIREDFTEYNRELSYVSVIFCLVIQISTCNYVQWPMQAEYHKMWIKNSLHHMTRYFRISARASAIRRLCHVNKKGESQMKRKIKCKQIKREFIFEHLVYTNYDLVLSSSRDFPRLKFLQFDFRWDLFLSSLSPPNIPTIHAFVRRPRPLPRIPSSRIFGGRTVGLSMAH